MKNLLKNYNLELLTALMFGMAVLAAQLPQLLPTQKLLVVYMLLYTLHEWEETRFPGGFTALMEGLLGRQFSEDAKKLSRIPVLVLLLGIHIIPFSFPRVMPLVLMPLCLALFESFVHTMGVKLSRAKRFYTPGMITAYTMAAFSLFAIWRLNRLGLAAGRDYALAALLTWACFALMQNRVLAINGISYRDLLSTAKSRLGHK